MMGQKYDVLIVMDYYLPGRKSGGPVTTIANMVDALEGLRFLIVTQNKDIDGTRYDLERESINVIGKSQILYLSRRMFRPQVFNQLLKSQEISTIYFNSFFSMATIKSLLFYSLSICRPYIILAPRGEFSRGAYTLKGLKKRIYVSVFKALYLSRFVLFQASSEFEKEDIARVLGDVRIHIAPDVPNQLAFTNEAIEVSDNSDKVVFISRISPKKNLKYALDVVYQTDRPVTLDIYGPLEDRNYWSECEKILLRLPAHVKVNYCGELRHDEVVKTFSRYRAFLFPTLGENYGHVIYESLSAGCPVITSDQTPWRNLEEEGVGVTIPLDSLRSYVEALQYYLDLPEEERISLSERCRFYARAVASDQEVVRLNAAMFQAVREKPC